MKAIMEVAAPAAIIFLLWMTTGFDLGPAMKMGEFNRKPADMVDPEYCNGNQYDNELIFAVLAVLQTKEGKKHAKDIFPYLLRGKRPSDYELKKFKAARPEDLVIEYGNGKKLAVFTKQTPTSIMERWKIAWDPNPPHLPNRPH